MNAMLKYLIHVGLDLGAGGGYFWGGYRKDDDIKSEHSGNIIKITIRSQISFVSLGSCSSGTSLTCAVVSFAIFLALSIFCNFSPTEIFRSDSLLFPSWSLPLIFLILSLNSS